MGETNARCLNGVSQSAARKRDRQGKNPKRPMTFSWKRRTCPIHRDNRVHKVQDLPMKPWNGSAGAARRFSFRHRKLVGMYVVEVPARRS